MTPFRRILAPLKSKSMSDLLHYRPNGLVIPSSKLPQRIRPNNPIHTVETQKAKEYHSDLKKGKIGCITKENMLTDYLMMKNRFSGGLVDNRLLTFPSTHTVSSLKHILYTGSEMLVTCIRCCKHQTLAYILWTRLLVYSRSWVQQRNHNS